MSSMGGGDNRRERRSSRCHRQHHQRDENWTLTPILDDHTPTRESSSASTPQLPQNPIKFSWEPSNRGGKSRIARKYQKKGPNSSTGVLVGVNGKEEGSDGDFGAELEFSSDTGEIQVLRAESEEGNKKAEGLKSNDEVDEDEIVERLKELRLSAEEPELPEELLSVNNQLQEDEVLLVNDASLLFESKECVLLVFFFN